MHGGAQGTSRPGVADSIRQCVSPHADCQALLEGQQMAERYGRETHTAESVPLSEAMSALLGECFHCFPENVPANAKPCQVWSGGVWVDGFLLEWQQGADGRWKGVVNYRHEAGRRVALKDQAELRPAGSSRRP
jgi:hypothetical protein